MRRRGGRSDGVGDEVWARAAGIHYSRGMLMDFAGMLMLGKSGMGVSLPAANAAPMGGSQGGANVAIDLVVMLLAAAVAAMILRLAKVGAIPAFLLTGALIGPHALQLVSSADSVGTISQLATILLMFIIGLHLDPSGLGGGLVKIGVLCVTATVASVGAMAVLIGYGPGTLGWPAAIAISLALVMSSTAVLLRVLQEERGLHKLHGRVLFGLLVIQDLLALAALALVPLLAEWAKATGRLVHESGEGGGHGGALLPSDWPGWAKFCISVGGIGLLIGVCRLLLPKLLREAAKHTAAEVPLILSAAVALGSAVLAAGLGLSPELGAFLAGFLLASTPFRHQLSGQLIPLRDLFMAVFFVAVGLKLDVRVVVDGWPIILMALVAVMLVKTFVFAATTWLLGGTAALATVIGLAMFQAGEFAIVILSVSEGAGLISNETLARLIVVVVLSLILTPTLYKLGHALRPWAARIPPAGWSKAGALREGEGRPVTPGAGGGGGQAGGEEHVPARQPHVILAGFGVVGRAIADRLELAGVKFVLVDLNQQTIAMQRKLGRAAIYGDISNPQVLESARIEEAGAVVLTIPDDEATLRACRVIRTQAPHVFIAARTSFLSKAMAASQLGADLVTVEEVATAETMARQVMEKISTCPLPMLRHQETEEADGDRETDASDRGEARTSAEKA